MDQNLAGQRASDTWKKTAVHISLILLTFFTTTIAGVEWLNKDPFELSNFSSGITYGLLILLMLASHEFGHYFVARHHHVKATLPFFIPFPSFFGLNPFGTMGAVIRLRSPIPSKRVLFDIGAAGPLAGFVVTLVILIVGLATLPSIDYLYTIHPEYAQLKNIPEGGLSFGSTLFYTVLAPLFVSKNAFLPPMNEIYHYPFLCVGWFGMLVTAMNLIPVGQLDGGHIVYAMFGNTYHRIAQVAITALLVLGLAGFLPLFNIDFSFGWIGWLFWAFVLVFFIRVLKLYRPPIEDVTPLDPKRMFVGWICIFIFIGSFSPAPFTILLR